MAEWIVSGSPGMDLWHMDVRRFGDAYRSPSYTLARTVESYETYYDIRYPNHERSAGRPLRMSAAYDWHAAHGAVFGEKSGWERVNYYSCNEDPALVHLAPCGWAGAALVHRRSCTEHAGARDDGRPVRRVVVRQARGQRS